MLLCKKRSSTDDDNKKYHKVRDYRHYTGKYNRGATYSICNLRYKTPKERTLKRWNNCIQTKVYW